MVINYSINTEDFSARFVVLDVEGLERYFVKNEMDSVMRRLTVFDLADNVVCTVEKKFFTLRPTYVVFNKHQQLAMNIRKKLSLLHPEFMITSELDDVELYTVGDYFGSTFSIMNRDGNDIIAKIARDKGYNIEILDQEHDAVALITIVIIIHLCCHHTKDE